MTKSPNMNVISEVTIFVTVFHVMTSRRNRPEESRLCGLRR